MKKLVKLTLLLVMVCVTCLVSTTCEAAKKTIAIAAIENNVYTSYGRRAAADIEAELTTVLVNCSSYNVVERTQLEYVLGEIGLGQSGLTDPATAVRVGKLLNADYTVIGNVVLADVVQTDHFLYNGTKGKIKFNLKFIDNETGTIKISEMIEGSDTVSEFESNRPNRDILISNAAREVAEKILRRLNDINPVVGNVLKCNDNLIYVNLGSDRGVHKGEKFIIYKEGEILTDPITNEIIAVEEVYKGYLKVLEVKPGYFIGEVKKSKGVIDRSCKVKRGE